MQPLQVAALGQGDGWRLERRVPEAKLAALARLAKAFGRWRPCQLQGAAQVIMSAPAGARARRCQPTTRACRRRCRRIALFHPVRRRGTAAGGEEETVEGGGAAGLSVWRSLTRAAMRLAGDGVHRAGHIVGQNGKDRNQPRSGSRRRPTGRSSTSATGFGPANGRRRRGEAEVVEGRLRKGNRLQGMFPGVGGAATTTWGQAGHGGQGCAVEATLPSGVAKASADGMARPRTATRWVGPSRTTWRMRLRQGRAGHRRRQCGAGIDITGMGTIKALAARGLARPGGAEEAGNPAASWPHCRYRTHRPRQEGERQGTWRWPLRDDETGENPG